MTFTFQNKPLAGDILATSQSDLQNNFQYLQASLGKDHKVNFGDTNATTFEGRHNQVSLSNIGSATPSFPSDGLDSLLYSFNGNIYWRNSTVTGVQLTGLSFSPSATANGYTFLPGGLLLQWATATSVSSSGFGTTFPLQTGAGNLGIKNFSTAIGAVATVTNATASVSATLATTSITLKASSGTPNVFFFAIGLP